MKPSYIIIVLLLLTNAATLVVLTRDRGTHRAAAQERAHDAEQVQRENIVLKEKLAAAEKTVRELPRTGIILTKPDAAKTAELRRRWNSPAQVALRAAEQRQIIDRQYTPLLAKLQLSGPSEETLKQLMVELRQAPREDAQRRRDAGLPPSGGPQSIARAKEIQQPIYDNIRTLLGEDRYAAFEHYNRTLTERQELEQITVGIRHSDTPLSAAQFDRVVDALAGLNWEVRNANGGAMPRHDPVEKVKERYDAVLEQSRPHLSPEQFARIQRAFADDLALKEKRATAGRR